MNQVVIFRVLILLSVGLEILGSSVDFLLPGLLPATLQEARDAYAAAEEPTLPGALALGVLALVLVTGIIAGTIGILLFKRWGRSVCLWLTVLSMAIYPFIGAEIYSGWALMLTETSMMLWGAGLAMAYFSDLKAKF